MINKRKIGTKYETLAVNYLRQCGYQILERNFYCKFGEIDIVAKKDVYLVFVEVKYRSSTDYGAPQEAVDVRKQRRISNASSYYLYRHHCTADTPVRFDVVAVTGDEIRLIENAFLYCGNFFC